ncbi:MAG: substrate-binding domain-containing protein [Anaerolineae bacterium]|nr:substrate-binding domain-containing protein [Anaerolineae bacterium]
MKRSRYLPVVMLLVLLSLVLIGCNADDDDKPGDDASSNADAPAKVTLDFSGSGTMVNILKAVEAEFEAANPNTDLNILDGTGTSAAIEGVFAGTLDVVGASREPRDTELEQGLLYTPFGFSGVGFIVHPDVEVEGLASEQVVGILSGEITNWAEVGGQDLPIVLYVRDEEDSATGALRDLLFGDAAFAETTTAVLTSAGDMVTVVEGTPGSFGFGTWSGIVARGADVKPLKLNGVLPQEFGYAITQPLGFGYLQATQADVQPLLDWFASEQGQTRLVELGVVVLQN